MKYIITENQYKVLRRLEEIKERVDRTLNNIKDDNELISIPLINLVLIVADNVGVNMADDTNIQGDDYVIYRNQIKQYIRSNFYDYIKEFWEANNFGIK